jgi:hypothetical protein
MYGKTYFDNEFIWHFECPYGPMDNTKHKKKLACILATTLSLSSLGMRSSLFSTRMWGRGP